MFERARAARSTRVVAFCCAGTHHQFLSCIACSRRGFRCAFGLRAWRCCGEEGVWRADDAQVVVKKFRTTCNQIVSSCTLRHRLSNARRADRWAVLKGTCLALRTRRTTSSLLCTRIAISSRCTLFVVVHFARPKCPGSCVRWACKPFCLAFLLSRHRFIFEVAWCARGAIKRAASSGAVLPSGASNVPRLTSGSSS